MSEWIRVLIADSEPLFCLGIQKAVETTATILCAKIVTTSQELLKSDADLHPNVILLGCGWQDTPTIQLIALLRQQSPTSSILALLPGSETDIQLLLDAGIAGAILRHERPEKWLEAIQAVASGEPWFSPSLARRLLKPAASPPALSERERLLLTLLVAGEPDAVIADRMALSEVTVRRCIKILCERFQVETRVQLVYRVGHLRLLN